MDEIARTRIGFSEVTTMKKRNFYAIFPFLGMLMLILDAKTALNGARSAVILCITTVIPSLFPFFVLSDLLTGNMAGIRIPGMRFWCKYMGIPAGAEGIFVTGLLGGYPTGAQAVHQLWQNGDLSTTDARHMLSFCSNAGPAFLFGILGQFFPQMRMIWLLWGIHILSAVLVAVLGHFSPGSFATSINSGSRSISRAVKHSVTVCGWVCGWIVIFRVMISFCQRWFLWLLPDAGQVLFYGFIELTGGCCALDEIKCIGLRFIIAAGAIGFGGFCVAMQTASVVEKLGTKSYWKGKLTQCAISVTLAYGIQRLSFPAADQLICPPLLFPGAIVICLAVISRRKTEKYASFPTAAGV